MGKTQIERWNRAAKTSLVGRTIVDARYMTDKEMKDMYWDERGLVMTLDNGERVTVSSDDEGNGPGALFFNKGMLPVIR